MKKFGIFMKNLQKFSTKAKVAKMSAKFSKGLQHKEKR